LPTVWAILEGLLQTAIWLELLIYGCIGCKLEAYFIRILPTVNTMLLNWSLPTQPTLT
jgi:hypothetical protein